MKYLLLIWDDEDVWKGMAPEEQSQMMKEYYDYTGWLGEKGWFVGGEALQASATGKKVQSRDGSRLVTDGPFAETKEQLGGFYLIEVAGEEEALEAAERLPSSRIGTIEVRAVAEMPDSPDGATP